MKADAGAACVPAEDRPLVARFFHRGILVQKCDATLTRAQLTNAIKSGRPYVVVTGLDGGFRTDRVDLVAGDSVVFSHLFEPPQYWSGSMEFLIQGDS